jgi:hypothetical protein
MSAWPVIGTVLVIYILIDGVVRIIRASKGASSGKASAARLDDLENDQAALEQSLVGVRERIEVLEKIVTDQRYDLGSEIDKLA